MPGMAITYGLCLLGFEVAKFFLQGISAKRCYRDALPIEECLAIIEDGAGTQFDPNLVTIFLDARDEIVSFCTQNKAD